MPDPTALPPLPARYAPTRLLGEGASGLVYHALDRLFDQEVAVKVVKPNLAMHRRFRARFAREVAISSRIAHPYVVPVVDTGVLPAGEPFVVLGYAVGGSLAELLKLRPPIADVLRLLDETLDALAAIHSRALVHQDLKPQNVLLHAGLDGLVHAWVADLGVADALAELNRDRSGISGTPSYMAPEQLQGRTQDLGPWTDLYAIGLMLFETLAGRRPHAGEGRQELLEQRLKLPPALEPGGDPPLPPELTDLVAAMLDPEPRQRFDRAADVRRALRDAVKGVSFRGRVRSVGGGGHTSSSTHAPISATGDYPLSMPPASDARPDEDTLRWNRVQPDPLPAVPPPEMTWDAPARASLALFPLRQVPLAGRERERRVLWDAAREVVALNEPRVVLVVGEHGSGKTRLVESVVRCLDEGGWMEVVRLQYHQPAAVDDGYRGAVRDLLVPWNDTRSGVETRLARWIGRDRQVRPAEVHEEASVLARWCGYLAEGEAPVNEAVGLAYLYRYLDAHAWRGGSCLVLEDAHAARAAGDGLAIAEALLDHTVGERPVLVLCTISAEALAADPALRRKVEGLQERGARRIGIRRLNLTETRKIVQESLLLEPELARLVSLECEGHPFQAELVLRDWAARRLLVPSPQGLHRLREAVSLPDVLPTQEGAMLERRIEAAIESSGDPAAAAEAMLLVALAGHAPPSGLLRPIAGPGIDALLATGVIREERGYLVFENTRLREAALAMSRARDDLAALHGRLADSWAELGAGTGVDVDLPVGLHRLRSGQLAAAVGPLLAATRKLGEGGRTRDAIETGAHAIEAADAVGQPTMRLEARRLHAQALLESGQPERAVPLIEHALHQIEGDRLARARLRVLNGRAARKRGDLEAAGREFDAAASVFQAMRDRAGLIEVAVQRAKLARSEGRQDEAITHWGEVLRLNRGDLSMEAEGLNGLVEALVRAGRLEHVDRQVQRLMRVARASGDTRRIAEATHTLGLLQLERRDLDAAERSCGSAGAIAATLGADGLHLRARTMLAEVHRFRGDLDAAEEANRWAARFADERGMVVSHAGAATRLALIAAARGDLARMRGDLEVAQQSLQSSPRHALWLHTGVLRALLAVEENDERTCRAWFAVARERGLHRAHAPDLWKPIERLATLAEERGWRDIATRARELVQVESRAEAEIEDG